MSVALRRRLKAVGAALAASRRIRLPEGRASHWSDEEVERVGVLIDVCGRELLTRLDEEVLAALAERWGEDRQGED